MVYWGCLGQKWWRNYIHVHSFYEICYAFEGQGVFRINGADHPIAPGDAFVAKPNEPHEIVSSRREPLGIYFWGHTLIPTTDAKPSPADEAIDNLLEQFAVTRCAISNVGTSMRWTLELLCDEIASKQPGYTQAVEGLTRKLLLDTARAMSGRSISGEKCEPPIMSSAESIVHNVIRYLHDNLSRPIQIRDVAAQVHLSPRHLSRVFQQITQVSLLDYLTKLRVQAAAQLLLDRQVAIKNIAREVGYPDVHYFTTLFRRRTGQTPAAFRAKGGTRFLERSVAPRSRSSPRRINNSKAHNTGLVPS
jgi:AraC family L-rhamnose operon transcriptional activator RhaR